MVQAGAAGRVRVERGGEGVRREVQVGCCVCACVRVERLLRSRVAAECSGGLHLASCVAAARCVWWREERRRPGRVYRL